AANGKAHLIPITIMYDGRFYDAGAYKAAPVPMALERGTVYEAVRSGVSQGLFTVTGAARAGSNWIGEGTWKSAEQIAAAAAKREVVQAKPTEPGSDRPPIWFYDAGAYKAAPVPMALEGGTVYEAVRSGVSQGLFTVTGAARAGSNWIGEGTWKSAEQIAAAAAKREVVQAKPTEPESDRP